MFPDGGRKWVSINIPVWPHLFVYVLGYMLAHTITLVFGSCIDLIHHMCFTVYLLLKKSLHCIVFACLAVNLYGNNTNFQGVFTNTPRDIPNKGRGRHPRPFAGYQPHCFTEGTSVSSGL